jgi:hypothetical protein
MVRNILIMTFKLIKPMLQIRTIMKNSSTIIARAAIPTTKPGGPYGFEFGSIRLLGIIILPNYC